MSCKKCAGSGSAAVIGSLRDADARIEDEDLEKIIQLQKKQLVVLEGDCRNLLVQQTN